MTKREPEGYPVSDERPHTPGKHPLWQESMLMHWWDEDNGVGGFHRIGHEVNRDGGRAVLWNGLFTREGMRFNRYSDIPFTDAARTADGMRCTTGYEMRFEDVPRLIVRDIDCELDLTVEDTMPRVDIVPPNPAGGINYNEMAPNHFEVAGFVRGSARIKNLKCSIDGLCFRDHSWGIRDWSSVLVHRWVTGSCGADLSFALCSALISPHGLVNLGFVVRNGVVTYAQSVDILVHAECDGITHRGGVVRVELPGGERLVINAQPIDAIAFMHRGILWVESMCTVEFEGRRGFCDFEVSTRPADPERVLQALVNASPIQGWSQRRTM